MGMDKGAGMLPAIIPPMLLILVLAGLLVLLVSTCIKFTKGPLSTAALKNHLRALQLKFISAASINPERERREMEILQNQVKTSGRPATISADDDLRLLVNSNSRYIQSETDNIHLENRSAWIQFRELMLDFKNRYFRS